MESTLGRHGERWIGDGFGKENHGNYFETTAARKGKKNKLKGKVIVVMEHNQKAAWIVKKGRGGSVGESRMDKTGVVED